jgi:hypothetical protein
MRLSMPALVEAPVYEGHQELPRPDDPLSVANDNGEGTAWVLEIPKPISWKDATVSLLVSGSLGALFTLSLLFVFVG